MPKTKRKSLETRRRANTASSAQRRQNQGTVLYNRTYVAALVAGTGTYLPDDVIVASIQLMRSFDHNNQFVIGDFSPAQQQAAFVDTSNKPDLQISKPAINILYLNRHWILAVFQPERRRVSLYDSLGNDQRPRQALPVLQLMYPGIRLDDIDYPKVDQQPSHDTTCGVYAIAFAFSLLHGYSPENENFNPDVMRNHLRMCISQISVRRFPGRDTNIQCDALETSKKAYIKEYMEQRRNDPVYYAKQNAKETLQKRAKRQDSAYRQKEHENRTPKRILKRTNPVYRKRQNEKETLQKRAKRQDTAYGQKEHENRTPKRILKRTNPVYRKRQNEKETLQKRTKRNSPVYRQRHNEKETLQKRAKRQDSTYRQNENTTTCKRRNLHYRSNMQDLITHYRKVVEEGPVYMCTSCDQYRYRHSMVLFTGLLKQQSVHISKICDQCPKRKSISDKIWICQTCYSYIKKGKIPPTSVMNHMKFIDQGVLKDLNPLELTLLSIRLPFMKLHQAPTGKQHMLNGNMVLVPADVCNTIHQLPRFTTETGTIKAKLKRKLSYKHHVYCLNVRPELIRRAAEQLLPTRLYMENNITMKNDWQRTDESCEEMVSESTSFSENDREEDSHKEAQPTDEEDKWSEVDENELMSGEADTMLSSPDFIEPNERQLVYSFAPGEGNFPVSIFTGTDSEELSFPGLFCGHRRHPNAKRPVRVTYGEIVKSELRNVDRRSATCIENLFFKTKKIQMKCLIDQTNLAVRKVKTKKQTLTAKDVKGDAALELVHQDKAYKFLANIRGSPAYFQRVSKDLFAMIRQLGSATFFVTLSAAETRWTHLLKILSSVLDSKNLTKEQVEQLSWNEKCRLIQSDPITCARHFDYSVQKIYSHFLLTHHHPLSNILDYFYRIEYQQRGSPHVHMMLWCDKPPKHGEDTEEDICKFLDTYITCSLPDEEDPMYQLVLLQQHRHSHTCRKKGKKKCRFAFPKPPMERTMVLEPLQSPEFSTEKVTEHKTKWKTIYQYLSKLDDLEGLTYIHFLDKLNIAQANYILAVRSSIVKTTIFLKRSLRETRINNYNPSLLQAWQANIDVQFVLDVYGCATYIASYVTKSQRGMSELLRKATQEVSDGNYTLKQQVRTVGNRFLNSVEISAQEAAYICLQLPMKKSSRHCIFINTSPPEERVTLLKPFSQLEVMDDENEDIECANTISRYAERQKSLEKITLAEFATYYDNTLSPPVRHRKTHTKSKAGTDDLLPEVYESDNDDEENTNNVRETSAEKMQYKRRTTPRILRTVHFNLEKDQEKYYRELIMLYKPWRNESQIIGESDSFCNAFKQSELEILTEKSKYEPFSETVDLALQMLDSRSDPDDAWDELAPTLRHMDDIDAANDPGATNTGIEDPDIALELGIPFQVTADETPLFHEMEDREYREHMRHLNKEQICFVNDVIHHIKTADTPIYRFLSGGAGVGKSYVTTALYQTALKFLNKHSGDNFTSRRILLLAPTGKAAYHIKGNTVHSALKIPPNQSLTHKPLSASSLNTLRNELGELKLIFIDEISMVGFRMFNFIHQRLMEVMQNNNFFGGVSVIAVGDLFQLKPVRDSYLFLSPRSSYFPLAPNLWQELFTMTELKEVMRQADNKPFAELLNRLREGDGQVMTFEELDDWLDLASAVATRVLTDDTFEHETQAATGATTGDWLVHFFKPSCDTHLPSIEAAALRLKGRKNIAKIDMESSPKLVERFQLTRCPTTIYFRHGRMFYYDMEKYDTKSLIAFVETWHKNVKGESVKIESTSFDHVTESIANMIKTQLEGENRTLFLVSIGAVSGLLFLLLVCCFCCGTSSDKTKTE